jgi:hypothetical protein
VTIRTLRNCKVVDKSIPLLVFPTPKLIAAKDAYRESIDVDDLVAVMK